MVLQGPGPDALKIRVSGVQFPPWPFTPNTMQVFSGAVPRGGLIGRPLFQECVLAVCGSTESQGQTLGSLINNLSNSEGLRDKRHAPSHPSTFLQRFVGLRERKVTPVHPAARIMAAVQRTPSEACCAPARFGRARAAGGHGDPASRRAGCDRLGDRRDSRLQA
jgi:hypothetical protein